MEATQILLLVFVFVLVLFVPLTILAHPNIQNGPLARLGRENLGALYLVLFLLSVLHFAVRWFDDSPTPFTAPLLALTFVTGICWGGLAAVHYRSQAPE